MIMATTSVESNEEMVKEMAEPGSRSRLRLAQDFLAVCASQG